MPTEEESLKLPFDSPSDKTRLRNINGSDSPPSAVVKHIFSFNLRFDRNTLYVFFFFFSYSSCFWNLEFACSEVGCLTFCAGSLNASVACLESVIFALPINALIASADLSCSNNFYIYFHGMILWKVLQSPIFIYLFEG